MPSKSQLAITLSKLKIFSSPSLKDEQYPTDGEIAADLLWNAHMIGDIENKIIADLGCGTGILGIGALLLGAKFVYFIDKDFEALKILNLNLEELKISEKISEKSYKIISSDIEQLSFKEMKIKAEIVLQNPPFGTKIKHNDKLFLEKAFAISPIIYSFHKSNTKIFISAISKDYHFEITHEFTYQFPLKQTMKIHKSKIKRIEVSCYRMERVGK